MRPWNPNTKSTSRPGELNPRSSDRPSRSERTVSPSPEPPRQVIEGLCAVIIILTLPSPAPTVELVIRQPQYGQPSVTSLSGITQRGWLQETNVHSMPSHSIRPSARLPVTIHIVLLDFEFMPHLKEDTGKPFVFAQEINPIVYPV